MSTTDDLVPTAPDASLDPVQDAEAMADAHLARQQEVDRVGQIVRWLDDLFRVPGTDIRVGLDAIIGFLLPGVGDIVTGAVGLTIIGAGIRRGVTGVVIARMLLNLSIDLVVGLLPVVGDAFDVWWRANAKNLALLERHQHELEPRARRSDYLVLGLAVTAVTAAVATPWVLVWMLISALG